MSAFGGIGPGPKRAGLIQGPAWTMLVEVSLVLGEHLTDSTHASS
jgi:hypothetical protein